MSEEQKPDKITKFVEAEMEVVDEIIQDETWYEGERRDCKVAEDDPKVQQLMDLGANSREARAALEKAGGDVEAAAEVFFGSWEERLASLGTWTEASDSQ